jgi:CheY-like chemotaxis protein
LAALLAEVERAAWRAQELTQQLLTFAKGGAPVRQAACLGDLIRDSALFALRGSNVRGTFDLAPDLWPAEVDSSQVSQVVHNLVLNATQAMPEGGTIRFEMANVRIEAGERPPLTPGPYVRFSLHDTGTGIEPDHLPKVFDPYFTTKPHGSGLGLATTYSIVRKHDGLITVDSVPGRGTTFHVWLPASPEAQVASVDTPADLSRGQGRILVMDDEPSIREFACHLLRLLGYTAEGAGDGNEALTAVRAAGEQSRPFAAVILDLTIPGGVGGREAIRLLREQAPGLRTIVSSGYSNDPVMAGYRAYGFDGVLAKPYKADELARVLHEVLTSPAPPATG